MIFESLDGLLCQVVPMIMRGNKLECHLVQVDSVLKVLRAFVVQDVKFGDNAGGPEAVDQGLVCPNHSACGPVLHWLNEDSITVDLSQDHDVLIPMAGFLWEAPWSVSEDLLGGLVFHVQDADEDGALFLGWAWCGIGVAVKGLVTVIQCWCSLLGGPYPLGVFLPCPFGVSLESG